MCFIMIYECSLSAEKLELSESAGPEGSFEDDILSCFELTIMLFLLLLLLLKTITPAQHVVQLGESPPCIGPGRGRAE
jgi:hypothetical protein